MTASSGDAGDGVAAEPRCAVRRLTDCARDALELVSLVGHVNAVCVNDPPGGDETTVGPEPEPVEVVGVECEAPPPHAQRNSEILVRAATRFIDVIVALDSQNRLRKSRQLGVIAPDRDASVAFFPMTGGVRILPLFPWMPMSTSQGARAAITSIARASGAPAYLPSR